MKKKYCRFRTQVQPLAIKDVMDVSMLVVIYHVSFPSMQVPKFPFCVCHVLKVSIWHLAISARLVAKAAAKAAFCPNRQVKAIIPRKQFGLQGEKVLNKLISTKEVMAVLDGVPDAVHLCMWQGAKLSIFSKAKFPKRHLSALLTKLRYFQFCLRARTLSLIAITFTL